MVGSPIYKLINLSQEMFLKPHDALQSVFWGLKVTDHILLRLNAWQMRESAPPPAFTRFVCLFA